MCVAYGNNECALITSWDAFDASFPYDYPYDPAISAANATVRGSRFGGRGGGSVTLRQAAEMAAMYDVFTTNPGRFGYESWQYREAETFSVTFLRKPLLMGSALGSPDALLAELNALDACLDRLSQGEHERRWQLLIVLGMGTGRDGVFAPDTGGGGGGQGRSDLASGQNQLLGSANETVKLPWYKGRKPRYVVNPAHVPNSPLFNPRKTPLPADAATVFGRAVPDDPLNPDNWYGINDQGQIYRYSEDWNGEAHFSGIDDVGDGLPHISKYARERLQRLRELLGKK
jgi:hypothetical protein